MSEQASLGILEKYAHILNGPEDSLLPLSGHTADNSLLPNGISGGTLIHADGDESNSAADTGFQPKSDADLAAHDDFSIEVVLNDDRSQSLILDWMNEVEKVRGKRLTKPKAQSSSTFITKEPTQIDPDDTAGPQDGMDSDDNEESDSPEKQKRRRKHAHDVGEYDYEDPFIDDDDDFFAEQLMFKPEVNGYFVWRGVVPAVEVDPDAETTAGSDDAAALSPEKPSTANNVSAGSDDEERRKSDMENQKSTTAPAVTDSNNVSPAKNSTPSRKKKAENDGLIIRKKKKKKTVNEKSVMEALVAGSIDSNAADQIQSIGAGSQPASTDVSPMKQMDTKNTAPDQTQSLTLNESSQQIQTQQDAATEKPKQKRQKKPLEPLPESVIGEFDDIKAIAATIEFKKGKFPGSLKDPLVKFARAVLQELGNKYEKLHGNDGKLYWNHLKEILPFQSLTLKKLVDKQVLAVDVEGMENDLQQLYRSAQLLIKDAVENTIKSYDRKLAKWKADNPNMEIDENGKVVTAAVTAEEPIVSNETPLTEELTPTIDLEAEFAFILGTDVSSLKMNDTIGESQPITDSQAPTVNEEEAVTASQATKKIAPPSKKLLWSTELRVLIYKIVVLESDLIPLKRRLKESGIEHSTPAKQQEHNNLPTFPEGTFPVPPFSTISLPDATKTDLSVRKAMYQHLMQYLFIPVGAGAWVTSTEISRQYALIKSKEESKANGTGSSSLDSHNKSKEEPKANGLGSSLESHNKSKEESKAITEDSLLEPQISFLNRQLALMKPKKEAKANLGKSGSTTSEIGEGTATQPVSTQNTPSKSPPVKRKPRAKKSQSVPTASQTSVLSVPTNSQQPFTPKKQTLPLENNNPVNSISRSLPQQQNTELSVEFTPVKEETSSLFNAPPPLFPSFQTPQTWLMPDYFRPILPYHQTIPPPPIKPPALPATQATPQNHSSNNMDIVNLVSDNDSE